MKEEGAVDRQKLINKIAGGFDATLIAELFPGIIHNLANPLNGIMGRATLMQRRTAEHVRKMQDFYPEMPADMAAGLKKIVQDADSIVRESDRFFSMFRDLTEKISAIVLREEERINLSQLIAGEMRFADFYLDFKHDVDKTLALEEQLPEVTGVYAIYSLCLSGLLRRAMRVMKASPKKEFSIATRHVDGSVVIEICDTGEVDISEARQRPQLNAEPANTASGAEGANGELLDIITLLEDCGARIQLQRDGGRNRMTIEVPVSVKKRSVQNRDV
jgi:signal transduction histidine kinase